jgi:hypothetical protein
MVQRIVHLEGSLIITPLLPHLRNYLSHGQLHRERFMKIKIKILCTLFLLFGSVASATTYYVATTGANAGHTGAIGDPWLTISFACSQVGTPGAYEVDCALFQWNDWGAMSFTASSSYTLTRIDVALIGVGTGVMVTPVYGSIYSDNSNKPGTQNVTSSPTSEQYTLSGTAAYYSWFFAGLTVTNGNRYWFVLHTAQNGTNYYKIKGYYTGGADEQTSYDGGATWSSETTGPTTMRIYGQ